MLAPAPRRPAATGLSQRCSGCHCGWLGSSGNAIGGAPLSELSIGMSVIDTTSEIAIAIATVNA